MRTEALESMIQVLAHLLRDHGDNVLDGTSYLTLVTPSLQVVTRLFDQLIPRGPGYGFQPQATHPSDSIAVLRTQLLLDMLQKTRALKLIHPPECPRKFEVNIFPFKSLTRLELKCLPPLCLRGLKKVYSQLEVLTCMHCITSIEEVLQQCGGDLCPALPWLELHTLNLSYNTIATLDKSLDLLNMLSFLDLSHNWIKDCGPHLKILSDLKYLNLGYNLLKSVPELSTTSSLYLQTLILRYNQLSSTDGLEHLSHLQNLDLSYNLLLEHSELVGLAGLHKLKKLFLEGNPLYYHNNHPVLTAQQLSRKLTGKVSLDGMEVTAKEILYVQMLKERMMRSLCSHSAESSGTGGDLTDSCSGERACKRLPRKKSKVRMVVISEPSDVEHENWKPRPLVFRHQKEIERTDSFREQYGVDWLRYRSHLEEELRNGDYGDYSRSVVVVPKKPVFFYQPFAKSKSSPTILQAAGKANGSSPGPGLEVGTGTAAADLLIEKIDVVLEEGFLGPRKIDKKEEDEVIEDALCLPITACPFVDGHPPKPDWPWVFLRVTRQHLVEFEMERGRVQARKDLQSLKDIQTSVIPWKSKGEEQEQELPVLTLYFHSMVEHKRCARYVVLDNTPGIKTLLDALNPILEDNKRAIEVEVGPPKLQCLKCRTEFINPEGSGRSAGVGRRRDKMSYDLHNGHSDHTNCPSCGSLHVVLAPTEQKSNPSTPSQSSPTEQSPEGAQAEGQNSFYLGDARDGSEAGSGSPDKSSSSSAATPEGNVCSLTGSYNDLSRHDSMVIQDNWQVSPSSVSPSQTLDFRIVDHRLKLHIDMEILGGELEEFQCYMKVPVVRFGKEEAFWSLVVVTTEKIYFLEITGETSGLPRDWLRAGEEQSLSSLTHLHAGVHKQTLHLGFGASGAAYTLLTRNCRFSTAFSQHILDALLVLPSRYLKDLDYSEEERVTEGHHLWHLLHHNLEDDSPPDYRYVLAHFLREEDLPANACANDAIVQQNMASPAARAQGAANTTPVSLLLTGAHMYILEETHQWVHTASPAGEDSAQEAAGKVQVKEKRPISSISSVHLYSSAALHLRIQLYNEGQQKETAWLLWMEDADLPKELVDWLRVPWEAEYHVPLDEVLHERLD